MNISQKTFYVAACIEKLQQTQRSKYKYLVIWYSIINKENYQKYCVK